MGISWLDDARFSTHRGGRRCARLVQGHRGGGSTLPARARDQGSHRHCGGKIAAPALARSQATGSVIQGSDTRSMKPRKRSAKAAIS